MSTVLSADRVHEIFTGCLFKGNEDKDNYVEVEGIASTARFHPGRLDKHKTEIEAMLDELPDKFKRDGGGGFSFLFAHTDKHGNHWTGSQRTMEELFQLGIAVGKAECLLPRDVWVGLPGGVPYYVVN